MNQSEVEQALRELATAAWDGEVRWPEIEMWANNFSGNILGDATEENDHALFALTKFIYFGRRLIRELLKSLYRDHFEAPLMQRIRRNYKNTKDTTLLRDLFSIELNATRFIGLGNPAESGAHLLYYFRQVNYLSKNLFADLQSLFSITPDRTGNDVLYELRDASITRIILFDDLVGSATQVSQYLTTELRRIRKSNPNLDISFLSLFATTDGLKRLNDQTLFAGKASCIFELDESFKSHSANCRYFSPAPSWFASSKFQTLASNYGRLLRPGMELGYKNSQLMLGFSHNTPDNTLPIFWDEGGRHPWSPVFPRFDKKYN